jgi:hypothetical protein
MTHTRILRIAIALGISCAPITALAEEPTKEVCLDAHSRGQDARDQGKLSLARKLFLTCAQPSCPQLVQGDCARFADDLNRMQPSINFAARDGGGVDLPDTSVYVDDILVKSRLDDGRPFDVDPGKHVVRFVHAGKDQVMSVVVGTGERGRLVSAVFGAPAPPPGATLSYTPPKPPPPRTLHAGGSKLVIGTGSVLAAGGAALGIVGILRVPGNCSISTHQCAAPPGDKSFADAHSAVQLSNIGWIAAGVGVAAIAGGVYWYVKSGHKEVREEHGMVAPWISPDGAGIALVSPL